MSGKGGGTATKDYESECTQPQIDRQKKLLTLSEIRAKKGLMPNAPLAHLSD